MKAPKNRRVFVIGYSAATPLGCDLKTTWQKAVNGDAGFRKLTRCNVDSLCNVVGEIPDWDRHELDFCDKKEAYNWNADYVLLTVKTVKEALENSRLEINKETGPKTACLIGSALNGVDAYRIAVDKYVNYGPLKVSPYLLPNLCANLPSGKAGMRQGFTGPIFSPQGACASGNYAIGIGAKMIRDGDCDFVLAGGVETCLIPEIIHGFENMNATIRITEKDRAFHDPACASRPFSKDRKGMVLSEGAGVLVLAAEEVIKTYGLHAKAEVLGVGWSSDAYHFTRPNKETIVIAIKKAIEDAELEPCDIGYVNTHGTSTYRGDMTEIDCLMDVFNKDIKRIPISSNKSQIGHTLGAAAAIEAIFSIEAMQNQLLLPTINHIPDPEFDNIDVVPNNARKHNYSLFLSNAFGFGGTNCCIVFKGV